jgi:hypothetical protein
MSDTVLLRGLEKIRVFYSVIFLRYRALLSDSVGVQQLDICGFDCYFHFFVPA